MTSSLSRMLFGLPILVLGSVLFNPTIVHADDAIKPGENGRSGESKTIFLSKPQSLQLNLSGMDGAEGQSFGSRSKEWLNLGWLKIGFGWDPIGGLIENVVGGAIERQNERDRQKAAERYPNYPNSGLSPDFSTPYSTPDSISSSSGQDGGDGGNGGMGEN